MYQYLDKIKNPEDLRQLSDKQLDLLCKEIREKLINTVSQSGGHLASNLGVVELTVALHRTLNAPKDKLVWDVGHQSYVHKILTGRAENLESLRSLGGLCGFCNPSESEYDASYTGHASASLSTALGMACAREKSREDYNVAAVIGDGAFTGGLAYEALNNIGQLKTKMLIILNDNEMSIDENVGAFSTFLAKARTNRKYTASKRWIAGSLSRMPRGGKKVMKLLQKIKNRLKTMVSKNMFFEQLGITYLGPVNGHNIKDMEDLFLRALSLEEPVIVHVITKKGKGYKPAEKAPQKFHGVAPFEKNVGLPQKNGETYSSVMGNKLCELAEKNSKISVVTPAMIYGSGLAEFAKKYPERLYDVGIAEGHAITFAAGLSACGKTPVVAIYSTFLQRGYDNVIHDVAIGNNHVVFAIDRAGLVAGDGATHQGVFDITYLTAVPNLTLLSPSSYTELEKMLDYAINVHTGPIAIRYPRAREQVSIDNGEFMLSKAAVIRKGTDVTIVAEGQAVSKAVETAEILEKKGISAEIIDVRTIKPLDFDTVFESGEKTGYLFTIEGNVKRGGMGEMISSEALERGIKVKIGIRAVEDEFVSHGKIDELNEKYRYLPNQIAEDIERVLKA